MDIHKEVRPLKKLLDQGDMNAVDLWREMINNVESSISKVKLSIGSFKSSSLIPESSNMTTSLKTNDLILRVSDYNN